MKKIISSVLLFGLLTAQGQTNESLVVQSPEERIKMLQHIGNIYFQDGDLENATSAFERILEIDPTQKDARSILGVIYVNSKNYAAAIENMKGLVEDYPEDYQALNNLAWTYATAEDSAYRDAASAIDLAQQALVLAPYDHHIWSTLSEAYFVSGQYEKANRAIQHLVKMATTKKIQLTKDAVDTYNNQIRKCSRAIETEKLLSED
jgi:tetratricopeptide (TPR) repeat protein